MVGSAKTALWRKWVSSSESSTFTHPVVAHLCGKGEQHLANSCPPPSQGSGSAGSPHRRLMSLLTDHYFQSGHVEGLTAEPVINKAEEWGWPVGDKESCLWREQKARGWNHHNDAAAHSWVMIAAGGAAGNSTAQLLLHICSAGWPRTFFPKVLAAAKEKPHSASQKLWGKTHMHLFPLLNLLGTLERWERSDRCN